MSTFMSSTRRAPLLAFLAAAACGAAPSRTASAAPHGNSGPPAQGHFLTDTPRWTVNGDPAATNECFGSSIATGDLDGDGKVDLVVAAPSCAGAPSSNGRIAIFRGVAGGFATTPRYTNLTWVNTSPNASGRGMRVEVADVDGDGRADIMVRSSYGVQVFAGINNLSAPLGNPTFRVPDNGIFGFSALLDLDGDGRTDLVSTANGVTSVWRATPGSPAGLFTFARTIESPAVASARDVNGDGAADLLVYTETGTDLYLGCPAGAPFACTGPLADAPLWSAPLTVIGTLPDSNGDGIAEVVASGSLFGADGRVFIHLSDPESGGVSPNPVWSALGDPLFLGLGRNVLSPGDLNRDGRNSEFLLGALGRLYAFFPKHEICADLDPGFAWPRAEGLGGGLFSSGESFGGQIPLAVAAPGDLDGDGFADLVVGSAREFGSLYPGRVHVFGGGKVPPPAHHAEPPYLPPPRVCGAPAGTKPDLTVDGEALARSLFIEDHEFAPDACELVEECINAPGVRRLLRFTTSVVNLGSAPMLIPGPDLAPELYHFDACHGHDHLEGFARYELRDALGNVVTTGRKQGFYMVDVQPQCIDAEQQVPDFYPYQGVSPGWSDVYIASLPCQWIDITGVPDGHYVLYVGVDEEHLVDQDDVLPDHVEVQVAISGGAVTVLP